MSWTEHISQIVMVVIILLIPYFIWTFIRRSVRNYIALKEEELELQRENNQLLRKLAGLPPEEDESAEEED
ncbi:MAG TPA: YebO family protein [Anseongella sp.]|nr:YebO family protein [Anseongella sp.]